MESPLAASVSRLRDGRLVSVNDAWLALTGLTREAAIGRTTVELGHWPDEAARQAYVNAFKADQHETLWLCEGVAHHVRLHSKVLHVLPEPLVLVYLTEASTEVAAERARQQTSQALRDANLALQQRVELHEAIEKLALVGHWTNAADDQKVFWSPGLYEIAGLAPRSDLLRSDVRFRVHPDDREAWLDARRACDGREMDFRWVHPDGRQRWFRTRMSRTAVAGNPQTDFGVVQDITAEREATQALDAQLKFIQNIAARVPGLMYQARLHPNGHSTISYVNEAASEMLELAPEALRRDARLLFARVHPDDLPGVLKALHHSATHLLPWRQFYRVQLPVKGLRYHSVESLPAREADGSILWHGFTTDVTEAREAQQVYDRQQRMLEVVRTAQAAFIEADDKRHAFESLLDALLSVTGSEYGFVGEVLHDLHGQPYLKTHAITNIAWDEATRSLYARQQVGGMEFHNLKTLFGRVLVTAEPLISNAPVGDARAGGLPQGHPAMSAFLGVPILNGGQLVGMVGLANQPGGYTEADIEFLQPLLGTVRQLVMAWRGHAERKRTRNQLEATSVLLAEKSAALQATFDSISQGLAMVDAEGRYAFYNQRMLELLNLPQSLMAGRPTHAEVVRFQLGRGDFGDKLSLVDASLHPYLGLEPQVISPDAYVRRTPDGRTLEILSRQLPDGGMVRTYADVTSYLAAQEALRNERQRLAWVLEATRPGIWEFDHQAQVFKVDDRWAEMLGYTVPELEPLTELTWRRLTHPEDVPRMEKALLEHLAGETDFYECDIRMRHKAGHWIWVNDRARVHARDEHGAALYMSGTHLDITDRVLAREEVRALNATLERRVAERTAELERSMKDMEAISYSIAHDLRAPLRSVNGFAALIAEDEAAGMSPAGREMFERIARSSRNMGQMITDMLELLRVVRVELNAVPVDMHALARAAVEALGTSAEQARLDVLPLPQALGDATLLRQVLINLMDNALKYSRGQAQPLLVLGFDAEKRAYFLRDNGMGFDMARAGKLFGLFQRLHVGGDVPGTGVGLAIVARIVERHGGRIWAESAPGAGATFWWTLPQPKGRSVG